MPTPIGNLVRKVIVSLVYFAAELSLMAVCLSMRHDNLGSLLLVIGNIFFVGAFVLYRKRTYKQSIEREAAKWLRQRDTRRFHLRRKWKQAFLWLPSVIAAIVLLFCPEVCAMISHLFRNGEMRMAGYEIPIPITWWITDSGGYPEGCYSYIWIKKGRGIGLGGSAFPPRLSHMEFHGRSKFRALPLEDQPNSQPATVVMPFLNSDIKCWEQNTRKWSVSRCSTSNGDFVAHFVGQHRDIGQFYEVLRQVKLSELTLTSKPCFVDLKQLGEGAHQ